MDVVLVGTYLISGIDLQSVPQEILVSCAKDSLAVAEKVLDAAPYTSTAENYPTAVALLARNILAERLPEALALARASVSLNEGNLTV
ncbi:hypothetical protein A3C87_03865 [Candidatus Kaiserbacteria bacterium RIFCSPHIGHO2_02_FULL_49_34]|uniref:Uncharacterized protein n=1 Tax=Candidatus Kaiserbacteria bacterium RIFCSPHIGHO2_02_FULL_49_34 TaxID=1798491 RepID=A0A1F6DJX7_9BACT|nr:MAG: hypothetical protein A3C87_03865 [Candidatus Kaiserbacteria bacterium RIFCSPHIGHO2_02_FULL_49_34]